MATHHGVVLRWTGDGIKAAFSTASDAVAAAVDVRRAVARHVSSDAAVAACQVRIGLGAGEVIIDDGDHHGVAVIEAARLEALARPGEILATDVVRVLGRRRSKVAFEQVGERLLKGLDHPVLVHRVIDVEMATASAMPRLLVVDHHLPLVGRDRELEQFDRLWAEARGGVAGLLLVRGRPGLGKTRLISACAARAHDDGAMVMAGACDSDLAVPYEPFAVALREVAALDEQLAAAVGAQSGSLARLFPGSTSSHAESQPAMARFELFDAVSALLRRLTRSHPVVLVLDDLQWATAPTVLLLRHLVTELGDARLVFVATYREEDLEPTHPLRELLVSVRQQPHAVWVHLEVLNLADVMRMVTAAAPEARPERIDEIARLVHRDSAGSPFFAGELLRHLAAIGQLELGATLEHLPVPDSVLDAVAQRLARLPEGVRELLTFAAVIGPSFDLDVLAAVVGRPDDDVLDLLDEVDRAGMVSEIGVEQFAFSHAIVRAALLDELTPTRRARAHRRVAEALEARSPDQFDELAHHWRLAGVDSKSTTHLARAARRDMVALAFESARARYQEVIELLAHDPHADALARAEAWPGYGAAGRALGDPNYVQAVRRAGRLARTARSAALMAEAAAVSTWLGTFFLSAEVPETEFVELCEDALSLLDRTDPMRVRVLATLASHLTFSVSSDQRAALIAEAGDLVTQHHDPLLTAAVLNAEFLCLWEPATLARREQIARELGRIARATGDPEIGFFAGFFTAFCQAEVGDLESSLDRLAELAPAIEATKNQYFEFLVDRTVLSIDIFRSVPDARQRVDDFVKRHIGTYADTDGTWALQTGGLAMYAGTLGQMVPALEAMTASENGTTWTAGYAMGLLWAGERDKAFAINAKAVEIPRNYFWISVTQARAEVAAGLEMREVCQQIFDELQPFRGRVGITASGSLFYGLVSRTLGMLALALDDLPTAIDVLGKRCGAGRSDGCPARGCGQPASARNSTPGHRRRRRCIDLGRCRACDGSAVRLRPGGSAARRRRSNPNARVTSVGDPPIARG